MATKKYHFNTGFFDNIDSEEKAYWLGFLYADGYNCEKRGFIRLALQTGDINHIKKFQNSLCDNHKIYVIIRNNSICIHLSDLHFSQRLAQLGCIQAKSLKCAFPSYLSPNLVRHFIRGYFDGDGCTTSYKSEKRRNYGISICSNPVFLDGIIDAIFNLSGIKLNKWIHKHGRYGVCYCGGNRKVKKFLDWLYQGANIYLERKYQRYLELCQNNKEIDFRKTYVFFQPYKKKQWVARLPSSMRRKYIGSFFTKQEAINSIRDYLTSNQ